MVRLAKKDLTVIQQAIRTLKGIECTFWMCPGWDKPYNDMETCTKCSVIQSLISLAGDPDEE